MCEVAHSTPAGTVPFNTLAQLRNLPGKGADEPDSDYGKRLAKRARSKYLSTSVAASLYLAVRGTGSPLIWSYGRSFDCAGILDQRDGTLRGKYCGCRWCITCGRIRTAKAINRYAPVVSGWSDAHLVTLTVPNAPGPELSDLIDRMQDTFNRCKDSMRKAPYREKLVGLRKLEVTYNAERDDFHPHYHVVTETRAQGEMLVRLWLKKWGGEASHKAQDVRPVNQGALMEVFKYHTKLLQDKKAIPPLKLDAIYCAIAGRRTYQPVGFVLPKADDEEGELDTEAVTGAAKRPAEMVKWDWVQATSDWVDLTTGEVLAEYTPSDSFGDLVEGIAPSEQVVEAEFIIHADRKRKHLTPVDALTEERERDRYWRDRASQGRTGARNEPFG